MFSLKCNSSAVKYKLSLGPHSISILSQIFIPTKSIEHSSRTSPFSKYGFYLVSDVVDNCRQCHYFAALLHCTMLIPSTMLESTVPWPFSILVSYCNSHLPYSYNSQLLLIIETTNWQLIWPIVRLPCDKQISHCIHVAVVKGHSQWLQFHD